MSKICRTFAAEKINTIMEKRTYIQPEMDTMILPAEALMDPITIPGSPEGPADPVNTSSPAPQRETPNMF